MQEKDLIVNTLMSEYSEIRQEIRDLDNSMDINFRVAITALSGLFGLAMLSKQYELLFLGPTLIFLFVTVHLVKVASANVTATYCQIIEAKVRSHLGKDQIIMNWEGGKVHEAQVSPVGVTQFGLNIIFLFLVIIFWGIAIEAYRFWKPSLIIHIIEFVLVIVYAIYVFRWMLPSSRAKRMEEFSSYYNLGDQKQSTTNSS